MTKKIWFITGISSGLGKALAEEIIATDDFVIGTFRHQNQVDSFNQVHPETGLGLLVDITNTQQIQDSVQTVLTKFGKLDVLVNNAGFGFAGAIEETSNQEVRSVFETNFFGILETTRAFLPLFRKQKFGHIFQISSQSGIKGFAGFGIYNASKFALEGLSEALAQEIAPLGIKLTIVEPGPFRTQFASNGFGLAQAKIDDYNASAGAFRDKIKSIDGKQEGDPVKAAQAIIQMANSTNPTLRLPLGKIAVDTFQAKIDSLQNDLNQNKEIAEKAVY